MIISHKYRFIFIKTYKTASTSVEVLLSGHCAGEDIVTPIRPAVAGHRPRNHSGFFNPLPEMVAAPRGVRRALKDLCTKNRFYNHMPACRIRARVPREIWDSYFKFCVERNPWDKVVSYYHASAAHLDFDEYLRKRDRVGGSCVNFPLYTERDEKALLVDRVIKYESLAQELEEVFSRLRIPFAGIDHIRAKSGHRPDARSYREYFNPEQREAIARWHQREIELHGYEF